MSERWRCSLRPPFPLTESPGCTVPNSTYWMQTCKSLLLDIVLRIVDGIQLSGRAFNWECELSRCALWDRTTGSFRTRNGKKKGQDDVTSYPVSFAASGRLSVVPRPGVGIHIRSKIGNAVDQELDCVLRGVSVEHGFPGHQAVASAACFACIRSFMTSLDASSPAAISYRLLTPHRASSATCHGRSA